jgi:hypothetical protein
MVPGFKPVAALEFITRFLSGTEYKKYVPKQRKIRADAEL